MYVGKGANANAACFSIFTCWAKAKDGTLKMI